MKIFIFFNLVFSLAVIQIQNTETELNRLVVSEKSQGVELATNRDDSWENGVQDNEKFDDAEEEVEEEVEEEGDEEEMEMKKSIKEFSDDVIERKTKERNQDDERDIKRDDEEDNEDMEEIVKEAGDDMNEYKGNQDADGDDEGDEIKQVDGIEKEMFNQDQDKVEIDTPMKPTILQIIYSMQELSQLASLLKARPALEEALSTVTNELTFFAPVNDAFPNHKAPPSDEDITRTILYHIVEDIYPSETFHDGELLDSALELASLGETQKLLVSVSDQDQDNAPIKINGHVRVIGSDLQGSNGIVHLVDRIITPPPHMMWMLAHSFREYAAFVLALKRTGLDSVVQFQHPGMLFAPTNSAFKKIPVSKLAYLFSPAGSAELTLLLLGHIAPVLVYSQDMITHPSPLVIPTLGSPIAITVDKYGTISLNQGDALIEGHDLCASNGVIHGIDSVLGINGVGRGLDNFVKTEMMSSGASKWQKEDWYLILELGLEPKTRARKLSDINVSPLSVVRK